MTGLAVRSSLARLAGVSLVACLVAACSSWGAHHTEPASFDPAQRLSRARLTLRDGSSVVVYDARVRSDSIVGLVRRQNSFQPISVSREQARAIQLPDFDALRTIGLIDAIVGVVVYTIWSGLRASLKSSS